MKTTNQKLKKIQLPYNDEWNIAEVTCDDYTKEIRVKLSYCKTYIFIDTVRPNKIDIRTNKSADFH